MSCLGSLPRRDPYDPLMLRPSRSPSRVLHIPRYISTPYYFLYSAEENPCPSLCFSARPPPPSAPLYVTQFIIGPARVSLCSVLLSSVLDFRVPTFFVISRVVPYTSIALCSRSFQYHQRAVARWGRAGLFEWSPRAHRTYRPAHLVMFITASRPDHFVLLVSLLVIASTGVIECSRARGCGLQEHRTPLNLNILLAYHHSALFPSDPNRPLCTYICIYVCPAVR
ncbi:hypothetical protein BD309DRAFT_120202 [Dichomitus squalens]|nr:hypothetical protein BD309DRAFT_120202 [Dichomitus squalens]